MVTAINSHQLTSSSSSGLGARLGPPSLQQNRYSFLFSTYLDVVRYLPLWIFALFLKGFHLNGMLFEDTIVTCLQRHGVLKNDCVACKQNGSRVVKHQPACARQLHSFSVVQSRMCSRLALINQSGLTVVLGT